MKANSCGVHTTQLTRLGISNCFLVREDDGLTLVDTSFRGSADAILRAAEKLGQPIRRIAITHAHHDHAGSLDALVKRMPDVEVLVSGREARILRGELSGPPGEAKGRMRGYLYEKSEAKPTAELAVGDRIGSLEAIDASGHTPGHLAFFDTRDRTLLAGDAFLTVGEIFVTTELVLRFPFPALSGTWHASAALESAERLCALQPARIATGHGSFLESPHAAMQSALARARERKAWG